MRVILLYRCNLPSCAIHPWRFSREGVEVSFVELGFLLVVRSCFESRPWSFSQEGLEVGGVELDLLLDVCHGRFMDV